VELFGFEPAVKSRRRKPVQQIVRRLKVCGFRVTAERGRQGARRWPSLLCRHQAGLGGHPHPPDPPFAKARSL